MKIKILCALSLLAISLISLNGSSPVLPELCQRAEGEMDKNANSISVSIAPTAHAKLKLLLVIVGEKKQELQNIINIIKNDLEFSGQFEVDVEPIAQVATKKEVASLYARGYSMAVFLSANKSNDAIEWRLYDTTQIVMLKGSESKKEAWFYVVGRIM